MAKIEGPRTLEDIRIKRPESFVELWWWCRRNASLIRKTHEERSDATAKAVRQFINDVSSHLKRLGGSSIKESQLKLRTTATQFDKLEEAERVALWICRRNAIRAEECPSDWLNSEASPPQQPVREWADLQAHLLRLRGEAWDCANKNPKPSSKLTIGDCRSYLVDALDHGYWWLARHKPDNDRPDLPDDLASQDFRWLLNQLDSMCRIVAEVVSTYPNVPQNTADAQETKEADLNANDGIPERKKTKEKKARPRQTSEELFKAVLGTHHQYRSDGSVQNYTPASMRQLEELSNHQLSDTTALRLIKKHFGDVENYRKACIARTISQKLIVLRGDALHAFGSFDPTKNSIEDQGDPDSDE